MNLTAVSPIRMLLMVIAGVLLALLVGCKPATSSSPMKPAAMAAKPVPTTVNASAASEPESIAIVWPSPTAMPARESTEPRILLADSHAPAPKKPTPVVKADHGDTHAEPAHGEHGTAPKAVQPAPAPAAKPAVPAETPVTETPASTISCPHCKHEMSAMELVALNAEADAKLHPADKAVAKLMAGNQRFVAGKPLHPNQSTARRDEVAKGQAPFAIILGCADSRTSPEVIFDAGLGDLFPIRVAGNIAEDGGIASMEYAVEHLGAQLIMVLGHERCGAVKATVDVVDKKVTLPGHLPTLSDAIKPAVTSTKGEGDWCDRAVIANAKLTAAKLRASGPILSHAIADGKLKVVAARYDLDTGVVSLIDDATATPAKPAMATTAEH